MAALVSITDTKRTPNLPKSVNKFGIHELNIEGYPSRLRIRADAVKTLEALETLAPALQKRLIDHANSLAGTACTTPPAFIAHHTPDHPFIAALTDLLPVMYAVTDADLSQRSPELRRLSGLPDIYMSAILKRTGIKMPVPDFRRMQAEPSAWWTTRLLQTDDIGAEVKRLTDCHTRLTQAMRELCPHDIITDDGVRFVLGDETAITIEASLRAGAARDRVWDIPEDQLTPDQRSAMDPRTHKRSIRRQALQAQAFFDSVLRLAGTKGVPFVSAFTLAAFRQRQAKQEAWAKATNVVFEDGTEVPMTKILARAQKAKTAQVYAVTCAMEHLGSTAGMTPIFITMTLPGEFHPTTTRSGFRASNDNFCHTPAEQHRKLMHSWEKLRSRLWKTDEMRDAYGMRVLEPHEDGTPHLHAMLWLPARYNGERTVTVVRRHLSAILPGRIATKAVEISEAGAAEDGRPVARAASYVLTYIVKSLGVPVDQAKRALGLGDTDILPDEDHIAQHSAYRAWASSRRVRTFAFVGVHGSLRILQRIRNAKEEEVEQWASPRMRACWHSMREATEHGERAKSGEGLRPADRRAYRDMQSAAWVRCLEAIGALRMLRRDDGYRLTLTYEDGFTEHGHACRRVIGIADTETGHMIPIRLKTAVLVTDWNAVQVMELEEYLDVQDSSSEDEVTVKSISPRAGSSPGLRPLSDEDAFLEDILRGPPDQKPTSKNTDFIVAA
ncbi:MULTISPECIES: replication endonuclease [Thalassospira]|uniref:replication endonuclease n=1 Tax=Thalassospira TaxID=168934 RepID=UPI0008DD7377|nr:MULTISPECIES: replication endonuclease [Thalassospira]MDM7975404.1 replication endonuclease [Thalassospira xiamenensis]OHZ00827.1 hypothetical protein BC440_08205 [Thalassospira sp. MIT1004]